MALLAQHAEKAGLAARARSSDPVLDESDFVLAAGSASSKKKSATSKLTAQRTFRAIISLA
jgi:hypothetical protein